MALDLATLLALAATCAPEVAPRTLLAVAQVESGFDPLAIGVNGRGGGALHPTDPDAAIAQASALIAAGRDVDLGLAQINARNLSWLGLTVEAAFDPCRNLGASARVLLASYRRAAPMAGTEQARLRTVLSYYNTGHATRGLANGYVAKVAAAADRFAPATPAPAAPVAAPAPPPPTWDVFARAHWAGASRVVVFPARLGARP